MDHFFATQFRHKSWDATRTVKVLKMIGTSRRHVTEMRSSIADFVKGLEGEFNPCFIGDRREVE
jgi:hypothetical protein